MNVIQRLLQSIMAGEITIEEIPEAKTILENEIAACDDVLQDPEAFEHQKAEYRAKRVSYIKALNRL